METQRKTKGRANEIDAQVGAKLRQLRLMHGMSQTTLGEALDVSFQQVQKYEKGGNRLSAGRLYEIAALFGIPVSELFDGTASVEGGRPLGREDVELIRVYQKLPDDARKGLRHFLRTLVEDAAPVSKAA